MFPYQRGFGAFLFKKRIYKFHKFIIWLLIKILSVRPCLVALLERRACVGGLPDKGFGLRPFRQLLTLTVKCSMNACG